MTTYKTSTMPRRDPERTRRMLLAGAAALANAACALPALAQCEGVWVQMPATGPEAHQDGAMSFDPSTGETLFLHSNGTKWFWNGVAWRQAPPVGPLGRSAASLAIDVPRAQLLLAGGGLDDAWTWAAGPGWTRVMSLPLNLALGCMGHDPVSGRTIYFGGTFSSGVYNTTFGWDGTAWATLATTGPSPRAIAAGALDPSRGRFLLFGGFDGVNRNDLWEWNGAAWQEIVVAGPRPSARDSAAAVGTPEGFFLFGGGAQDGSAPLFTNETWRFASGQWTMLASTGPSPRRSHVMAYDPIRRHVVLFGGRLPGPGFNISDESWVWSLNSLPVFTSVPADRITCPAGTATFSVIAAGSGPFTYQWQWEEVGAPGVWTNLLEGPNTDSGGVVRFTATGALTPSVVVARDNHLQGAVDVIHAFRVIVTNACGSVTSNPATLAICVADTDDGSGTGTCDGGVTIDDLLYYLVIFEQGTLAADVDDGSGTGTPDGGVTIDDLLYYLQRFEAGC